MDKKMRFNLVYVVIAVLGILMVRDAWVTARSVEPIAFSEFQQLLKENKIAEVTIGSDTIEGRLKEPREGRQRFITTRVDTDLAQQLQAHDVKFAGRIESSLLPVVLSWVVPTLLFFGLWMLVARRLAGKGSGLLAIGKSKAKVFVENHTSVTFQDVAGVDEAKEELREIVSFLKDPKGHGRLGARMPKGVLLVGPPGTGKTLLARAVAGEAGVPFFSLSGSEFVEMFVGVGAARVRDLFEQARLKAPAIIFIDELDALGRARGQHPMGGHDEKEQTLNQLLVEMDGFNPTSGIVLLAATNRPEVLDPALMRAGRFDRQVLVDRPDKPGRVEILEVHMKRIAVDSGVSAAAVADLTPGFTGADLANLVNEAALAATRRGAQAVNMGDFTAAIERLVAGLEKRSRLLSPREREVVAHHEMGHALASAALPNTDPVHKVSIIPRGVGALGYTMHRPTGDRYLHTRQELENRLVVLLGGRAAESLIFGQDSTGAADDLARATDLARNMVKRYAMVPALGPVTYDEEPVGLMGLATPGLRARHHSEQTAREIDLAVRQLVERANVRAQHLLQRNHHLLTEGARQLLAKETLDDGDLQQLFSKVVMEEERAADVTPYAA